MTTDAPSRSDRPAGSSGDRPATTAAVPDHRAVLAAAVSGLKGADRPGQLAMADAIADAFESGTHLLVQAGTGTGKSLGYLAPALARLTARRGERIIVATATLALQGQLANNDIPAALDAVEKVTGRRPRAAILKGRTNYACRLKVSDGSADEQGTLLSLTDLAPAVTEKVEPGSALGAEVLALRTWADEQHQAGALADRDDAPTHTERAWQQVSVPVRECLGQQCAFFDSCFVERSRESARQADIVVTNHALLAINAMHGGTALPEHTAVVIDEAHELVARVTGAASAELSPAMVERVARRALTWLDDEVGLDLLESADALRTALDNAALARVEDPGSDVALACGTVRSAARTAVSALTGGEGQKESEQRQAAAAVKEVYDVAERMSVLKPVDVVWVTERERSGRELRVAPLSVALLMRDRVFGERPTILTSATLTLGGSFDQAARSVGLRLEEQVDDGPAAGRTDRVDRTDRTDRTGKTDRTGAAGAAGRPERVSGGDHTAPDRSGSADDQPVESGKRSAEEHAEPWSALDVGSPFDYRRQGILYVARNLPAPGRDGLPPETLAEIAELVWAAGGRTLGLFSSRRAAEAAAAHVRRELPKLTVLCQGDAQLSELTRTFVADEKASLFGTLSLWQGVDVPGATCQLVIIDRIPFPRPDDPLTTARQRAVAEAGGNGFMAVAATHAALLLAQGAGRLIRRISDRGMVAVLDPRLVSARYAGFLRTSMPDLWPTTDRELAVQALRRLGEQADQARPADGS